MTAEEIAEGVKADDFAESMAKSKFARNCADCFALHACQYTFGLYWRGKSNDGQGCRLPMSREWAEKVTAYLYAHPNGTKYRDPGAVQGERDLAERKAARKAKEAEEAARRTSTPSAAETPRNPLLARLNAVKAGGNPILARIKALKEGKKA